MKIDRRGFIGGLLVCCGLNSKLGTAGASVNHNFTPIVSGAVGAVSAVIGNFQRARASQSLDLINQLARNLY